MKERIFIRSYKLVPEIRNPLIRSSLIVLLGTGLRMVGPWLISKGVDEVAFRIRDLANDNDVPIVENPPLARALFAAADLDDEVPSEHYKAVAEIISYVFQLKNKKLNN